MSRKAFLFIGIFIICSLTSGLILYATGARLWMVINLLRGTLILQSNPWSEPPEQVEFEVADIRSIAWFYRHSFPPQRVRNHSPWCKSSCPRRESYSNAYSHPIQSRFPCYGNWPSGVWRFFAT